MPLAENNNLQLAYDHCMKMVRSHYENFPVASLVLPIALRRPVSVIYAFARSADDIADEGNASPDLRLQQLDEMSGKLDLLQNGATLDDPVFIALADVIKNHNLPVQLFHDLLSAFRQDVTKQRYNNFDEVLYYCKRSANPVGRLLLYLTKQDSEKHLQQSDAICSALQLINFYQDILQDYQENNRIYFPQDEMQKYTINEKHIKERLCDPTMQAFLGSQYKRARDMMLSGFTLGLNMRGRFGLQLRMMINGGLKVLELLDKEKHRCYSRPRLKKHDWLVIIWRSILKKQP